MARHNRAQHDYAFATDADFNEQLYQALRQSPWWMTSVAIHVMVFFILTLFDTSEAPALETKTIKMSPADVDPLEPPPEDVPKPVNAPLDKTFVEKPLLVENPDHNQPEEDNDLPHEQPFGPDTGISDAHFEGPSKNGTIGIGANAGGSPGGLGGRRTGGGGGQP